MDTQQDSQSQQNTGVTTEMSNKNIEPISFFEKDKTFVFVYKKTEKLTTALYMITNLFSDHEPMKWTLRKKVSELLSFTIKYKDLLPSQYSDFTQEVKTKILEIVSLLDVSSRSGLVSPMNFSILKQEFSNLTGVLDASQSTHGEPTHNTIPQTFFDVPQHYPQPDSRANFGVHIQSSFKDSSTDKDSGIVKDKSEVKRTNRQNIIMQLLKKKNDLTIKDIAQVIRDCSEKTIQRELISLISAGVIKKTGERRWSKYSLI